MTEAEIKANYKAQHDTLSESYYAGTSGLTQKEFDIQHGAIWDAMTQELIDAGYILPPTPPLIFEPSNPSHNPPTRIEHIEDFLRRAYP